MLPCPITLERPDAAVCDRPLNELEFFFGSIAMTKSMDDIVALCRRRGFIFQSSEIYGGINGFWDYGPLGAELKRNLKNAWWHDTVQSPPIGPDGDPLSIVGLDSTIIMNPKVWEASGHVAGFNDPMVDCRETKNRYRADHLWVIAFEPADGGDSLHIAVQVSSADEANAIGDKLRNNEFPVKELRSLIDKAAEKAISRFNWNGGGVGVGSFLGCDEATRSAVWAPHASEPGTLTAPRQFNLMFQTYIGATATEDDKAYLRPETAQGIFTNFWNVVDTSRVKMPFGIAQTGKAFRNEVTPRNYTFRSREFEQMEIEFFFPDPDVVGEDIAKPQQWYEWWRDYRYQWWQQIGLAGDNLQLREHDRDELAHYAKEGAGTSDIEYRFPFTAPGFGELEGIAHRSNFDLRQHALHVNNMDEERSKKMRYFDQEANKHYFPHVIEPSAGADRGTLALLCEAYTPDESRPSKVFMKFTPRMAPCMPPSRPVATGSFEPSPISTPRRPADRAGACHGPAGILIALNEKLDCRNRERAACAVVRRELRL